MIQYKSQNAGVSLCCRRVIATSLTFSRANFVKSFGNWADLLRETSFRPDDIRPITTVSTHVRHWEALQHLWMIVSTEYLSIMSQMWVKPCTLIENACICCVGNSLLPYSPIQGSQKAGKLCASTLTALFPAPGHCAQPVCHSGITGKTSSSSLESSAAL